MHEFSFLSSTLLKLWVPELLHIGNQECSDLFENEEKVKLNFSSEPDVIHCKGNKSFQRVDGVGGSEG